MKSSAYPDFRRFKRLTVEEVILLPLIQKLSDYVDQRLSTEGKILSKCCNISKTLGRGSITRGMNLRVRPRGNINRASQKNYLTG